MRKAGRKRFKPVSAVLPRVLRRLHLDRAVAEQPAVAAWPEVAGDATARHARARSIENGVLVVVVDNAGWKTQLTWLKPQLLTRLNARLGRRIVRDIRLVLGGGPGAHQP